MLSRKQRQRRSARIPNPYEFTHKAKIHALVLVGGVKPAAVFCCGRLLGFGKVVALGWAPAFADRDNDKVVSRGRPGFASEESALMAAELYLRTLQSGTRRPARKTRKKRQEQQLALDLAA